MIGLLYFEPRYFKVFQGTRLNRQVHTIWFHNLLEKLDEQHKNTDNINIASSSCLDTTPSLTAKQLSKYTYPVAIYFFKVNNGNTREMCEIGSKLTNKDTRRSSLTHSGVFLVNLEQILHIVLVFLLLF